MSQRVYHPGHVPPPVVEIPGDPPLRVFDLRQPVVAVISILGSIGTPVCVDNAIAVFIIFKPFTTSIRVKDIRQPPQGIIFSSCFITAGVDDPDLVTGFVIVMLGDIGFSTPLDGGGFHPVPRGVFVLGPAAVRFNPFEQVPPGVVDQAHHGFFRLSRRLRQVTGDQAVEVVVFVDDGEVPVVPPAARVGHARPVAGLVVGI